MSESLTSLLQSLVTQQAKLERGAQLREALDESGLPASSRKAIRQQFEDKPNLIGLVDAIDAEKVRLQESTWGGDGEVRLPGQERGVQVGADADAKRRCALDGFWAGQDLELNGQRIARFSSLQEAYVECTGRRWDPISCLESLRSAKYDSHARYGGRFGVAITESLSTTSWPQILGDSITRRMLAEYSRPDYQSWRPLVSDIGTITDFRTQRRMRFGGYGLLPLVPEGQSYTPLPSPLDQEAQYAVEKRGGIESITLEALANDGATGAIRRIPERLGRAAAITLHRQVFGLIDPTANAALTFDDDTGAIYSSGHNNLLSAVTLDAAGLDTAMQKLAAQVAYNSPGDIDILGLRPKYLLVPPVLERTALKLTQTERGEPFTADNDANIYFLQHNMQVIVVRHWTNTETRWVLAASAQDTPTIEVGFFRGREDPEIFVSDQENNEGSAMWSADRVSWKIRFIYGAGVMDYRGFVASR